MLDESGIWLEQINRTVIEISETLKEISNKLSKE